MNNEAHRLWWPDETDNEDLEGVPTAGACIVAMLESGEAKTGDTVKLAWSEKIGSTMVSAIGPENFEVIEGDCISDKADWFVDVEDPESGASSLADLIVQARECAEPADDEAIKIDVEQYQTGTRSYRIVSASEIHAVPAEPDPRQRDLLEVAEAAA